MDTKSDPAFAPGAARNPRRMLRIAEVISRTGLSSSSIYREIQERGFPKPARIGRKAVAWVESEIEEWLEARIAERG